MASTARSLPPLPEADESRTLTLAEYSHLLKTDSPEFRDIGRNLMLKGVVLNEIEKRPRLWKTSTGLKGDENLNAFSHIAIDVYKRTGILLHIGLLLRYFRQVKETLKKKLWQCDADNRSLEDSEKYLFEWDTYPYARFLRSEKAYKILKEEFGPTRKPEENVQDVSIGLGEIREDIDEKKPELFEHDSEQRLKDQYGRETRKNLSFLSSNWFPETSKPENQNSASCPLNRILEKAPSEPQRYYYTPQLSSLRRKPVVRMTPFYFPKSKNRTKDPLGEPSTPEKSSIQSVESPPASTSSTKPEPPALSETMLEKEFECLRPHFFRVAQANPEKIALLRKCMYDVFFQFDMGIDYKCAKDFFTDLSK